MRPNGRKAGTDRVAPILTLTPASSGHLPAADHSMCSPAGTLWRVSVRVRARLRADVWVMFLG